MVFSRINHKFEYVERQEIDERDWNHKSALYKIEIEDKSVVIVFGKPNFEFDKIIYFRIYLVSMKNKIEGQLGVFEIGNYSDEEGEEKELLSQLFDSEKDVNIHIFEEPLLFYFAKSIVEATKTTSESYLLKYNEDVVALHEKEKEEKEKEKKGESDKKEKGSDDDDDGDGEGEGNKKLRGGDGDGSGKGSGSGSGSGGGGDDDESVVVFHLHADAPKHEMPGEGGSRERIRRPQMLTYRDLIYKMKKYNWRKMLHDSWDEHPFELDSKKWKSVVHYVEGSKFKHEHPDTYKRFSLNSDSNISKQVALALSAGSASGMHEYHSARQENILLREKDVTVDKDYSRSESREKALFAKFDQHRILKELLLATSGARLVIPKYASSSSSGGGDDKTAEVVVDTELMSLRDKILRM